MSRGVARLAGGRVERACYIRVGLTMQILERLLAPVGTARFFAENWAKSPIAMQGDPERLADLFDWQGLDQYLNHHLRFFVFPAIQLYFGAAMGGARVPPEFFTESIQDANRSPLVVASPQKIRRLCREGATLLVHSVHDGDPRLKRFAAALQRELGETLRVDLFYTPPKSSGVHAHFDREDVLVLQIEGEKEWHLSAPTVLNPLVMPSYAELEDPPRVPDTVIRLARGDVMHIPRGVWHSTHTSRAPSLHLSVRVACRTGIDLLRWAVDALEAASPAARANLPLTLQSGPPFGYDVAAAAPAVRALRDMVTSLLDAPDFMARYNRACVQSDRAEEPYRFAAGASPQLDEGTRFSRPATQRAAVDDRGDVVALVAWGRALDFPRSALPVIDAVLAASRFTGGDLVRACAGAGLAWRDVAPVVARLMEEGLVFVEIEGRHE